MKVTGKITKLLRENFPKREVYYYIEPKHNIEPITKKEKGNIIYPHGSGGSITKGTFVELSDIFEDGL